MASTANMPLHRQIQLQLRFCNHYSVTTMIRPTLLAAGILLASPAHALIVNTVQDLGTFQTATIDGMTIDGPTSAYAQDIGTAIIGGVCVAGKRSPISKIGLPCGDGILPVNGISLSFESDQIIESLTLIGRSFDLNVSMMINWTGGGNEITTEYAMASGVRGGPFQFATYEQDLGWLLPAGERLKMTAQFNGPMDLWLREVRTRDVPGPAGVLGIGAAFAWARNLRRRCRAADQARGLTP